MARLLNRRCFYTGFTALATSLLAGCAAEPVPTADAPSEIQFIDITVSSKVRARYHNGREAEHFSLVETLGGGVALFDYDHDGLLDILLPQGGEITPQQTFKGLPSLLFRHEDLLTFADSSKAAGIGASSHYTHGTTTGDYNNDGFVDVLITGYGGVTLWENLGDGTFQDVTASSKLSDSRWSSSAGFGDLNQDGSLDIYIAHYANWSFSNNPNCEFGQPVLRDVCPPRKFEGLDDVVYIANGDGTFRDNTTESGLAQGGKGLGVVILDLDHDGDLDVYVANDTDDNFLYSNQGNARFTEIGLLSGTAVDDKANSNGSMGVGNLDLNNDGMPDIWVTNFEDEAFAVYENHRQMLFSHESSKAGLGTLGTLFVGFGTVCGDFDNDGDEDIAVANGHAVYRPRNAPFKQTPLLLSNDSSGHLQRVQIGPNQYMSTPHSGRGLAMGDLDNDGDLDLVFTNLTEDAAVLRNEHRRSTQSIVVELVGTQSPRDGTGARLEFSSKTTKTIRHAAGGGSYLSSSDRRIHFGYQAENSPDTATIYWPSGCIQHVTISTADKASRLIRVIESQQAAQ